MEINITPDASQLWLGIAGYFDTLSQVLSEFIDNSVSNFVAMKSTQRTVRISLNEVGGDCVRITIEDTGSGIKDLRPSLRLGDKSVSQTPLNEHGFGLKHALASANPGNDSWSIATRTNEEFKNGTFRFVKAPYSFDLDVQEDKDGKWPGIFNGPGTIIQFDITSHLFNTLRLGVQGQAGFKRCLEYLTEELGYIYAGVIPDGHATLTVVSDSAGFNSTVAAVIPEWVDFYKPGQGSTEISFDGKTITELSYEFGEMRKSTKYLRHYQRNMNTSGVEIRINGRLMIDNLFTEIWGLEKHNSYNHFLVRLNLKSDALENLPKTRTSKTAIRPDDPILTGLFEWIKKTCPEPPEKLSSSAREDDLVGEFSKLLETYLKDPTKRIEREFTVFKKLGSPLPMDLYVYDGKRVTLYEAKKDRADVQSVYQLIMYWDGLVADGNKPDVGVVIASEFSAGVKEIISMFNARKDAAGNNYNISTTTWKEEKIDYPVK